jgi:hypothetical protein
MRGSLVGGVQERVVVPRYRTVRAVNPLTTSSASVRRADQRAVRKSNLSLVARRMGAILLFAVTLDAVARRLQVKAGR